MAWWRHQMETFSVSLAICARDLPVTGEFPVHKGQWRGVLICARINGDVNNWEAGGLRIHLAHYGVTVIVSFMETCLCKIETKMVGMNDWSYVFIQMNLRIYFPCICNLEYAGIFTEDLLRLNIQLYCWYVSLSKMPPNSSGIMQKNGYFIYFHGTGHQRNWCIFTVELWHCITQNVHQKAVDKNRWEDTQGRTI